MYIYIYISLGKTVPFNKIFPQILELARFAAREKFKSHIYPLVKWTNATKILVLANKFEIQSRMCN